MIKLLHIGDTHIGVENYGEIDKKIGVNQRVLDFLKRLDDAVNYGIDYEADIVLFVGDAFDKREPTQTLQREFIKIMRKIPEAGIPLVMVPGNHDMPAVSYKASSLDIWDAFRIPGVIIGSYEMLHMIRLKNGRTLNVATMPYPLRSHLVASRDTNTSLQELVIENIGLLAAQAKRKNENPTVFAGHFTIGQATLGSEQRLIIGNDLFVPVNALAREEFSYVAMGHIHKHQSLNGDKSPPVVYCGSISRVDFGEMEEKGWVWVEIDDKGDAKWKFVTYYKVPDREFISMKIDVRGENEPLELIIEKIKNTNLEEAIVKIIIIANDHQRKQLSQRRIIKTLEQTKAHNYHIERRIKIPERIRMTVPVEELTVDELLLKYFEMNEVDPARTAELMKMAREIMEDANE